MYLLTQPLPQKERNVIQIDKAGRKTVAVAWEWEASPEVKIYGLIDEEKSGNVAAVLVECDAVHRLWGHSGGSAGTPHYVDRDKLKKTSVPLQYALRLVKLGLAEEGSSK
jgi:hypothetical protein